jgi:hypothetical protein
MASQARTERAQKIADAQGRDMNAEDLQRRPEEFLACFFCAQLLRHAAVVGHAPEQQRDGRVRERVSVDVVRPRGVLDVVGVAARAR